MNRPSLVVLDVGHGNAAVLLDTGGVTVIDAGKGGVLIDFLKKQGIKRVDVMLISHADNDHVRNAPDVLLDKEIEVGVVCYNSDVTKQSRVWKAFRKAIKTARREKNVQAEPQLTTSQTGRLDRGDVRVEVLYPFPETAASGPGGEDEEGEVISANSMSAVVRLKAAKGTTVMLAGDVEPGCLRSWKDEGTDATARVLVYPHHGGNPGHHDPVVFAQEFSKAVNPGVIIFSIHRSQYELPIPGVVDAVRKQLPHARIICTQLSTHCASDVPADSSHLTDHIASGKSKSACCAGTVVIDLTGNEPSLFPNADRHLVFIKSLTGAPLCLK